MPTVISSREGVAMAFAPSRKAADSTVASESELTPADVNVPNSSQGKKSGSDDEKAVAAARSRCSLKARGWNLLGRCHCDSGGSRSC